MLTLLLPLVALAAPITIPAEGGTITLTTGESAECRASPVSSANDIVTVLTLRNAVPGEARLEFKHTDHCLKGRPRCPDGTITDSKEVSLKAGASSLVNVLWTSYTFTLKEAGDGKATIEVVKPSAHITSKAKQRQGAVEVAGSAVGVAGVEVSITAGARGTDYGKSVTAAVIGGHWVAPLGDVPPGRYSVMVSSSGKETSLTQGKLIVR